MAKIKDYELKAPQNCLIVFRTKSGKITTAYGVNLLYTAKVLTFDSALIAELLGLRPIEWYEVKEKLEDEYQNEHMEGKYIIPV